MSGLFSRVSKNFRAMLGGADVGTSDGVQAEADGVETRLRHLTRGDDTHVLAHAEDKDADRRWCKVGVRIILPPEGMPEIQSSFGIDAIDFALEEDFAPQSNLLETTIRLLAQHLPDLDAGVVLRDQLDQSFSRIRQCWSDNAAKGYTLDRFSAYKDYRWKLVLGAPSTALGSTQMIGVQFNEYQKDFRTAYDLSANKAEPINQDVLSGMVYLSGHEKLQILQGEPTEALRSARAVFEEARIRGRQVYKPCYGVPGPDATGWGSAGRIDEAWGGGVQYANGDSTEVGGGSFRHKQGHQVLSFRAASTIAATNLRLQIEWKADKDTLEFRGGYGSKGRFPSIDDMILTFRTFFERMVMLDPVWPDWILEKATADFDPDHPSVKGFSVPPRHQQVITWILDQGYARQTSLTESFVAKQEKTTAKREAAADQPAELADGAMFGDIKTGHLKFFEKAKITRNARTFIVHTISDPDAKRRKRGLTYLWGGGGSRPLTPKQIARLIRYTKPDALWLMPDHLLGRERRDVIEAAFRISFDLSPGSENPFLSGWETITHQALENERHELRITQIEETDGYGLSAFSIEDEPGRRNGNVELSTGVGVYVLTTPKGQQAWLRPSFLGKKSHLPPREREWLRTAIAGAFPLDPERAEEITGILDQEWDRLSETYPEA